MTDFTSGFRAGIEKAAEAVASAAWKHEGDDTYSQGMDSGARHQLKTCLDAVRALLPEGAEGWRTDMENAPRDPGVFILGWCKQWEYAIQVRWLPGLGKWSSAYQPTHWMHLPSPPTGKGE